MSEALKPNCTCVEGYCIEVNHGVPLQNYTCRKKSEAKPEQPRFNKGCLYDSYGNEPKGWTIFDDQDQDFYMKVSEEHTEIILELLNSQY